jgi:6,7-dimethyl-8-ribityllumazine synthase
MTSKPKQSSWRIAVVTSRFNEKVTGGLQQGALNYLKQQGIAVDPTHMFSAPGAFEVPLLAQTLAKTGKFDGIVCLGCVTKHETAHFEFVSLGATMGLMQAILNTDVPIAFGILTTYTDEQAKARSSNDANNKGIEAAAAVVETLEAIAKIKALA